MDIVVMLGLIVVVLAGLTQGVSPWPIKFMRRFEYEHWAFVAMLVGLIVVPWIVTLLCCPGALAAYREVGAGVLVISNLFSLSWGLALIFCLLAFVRVGVSLTQGILTGVGVSIGVSMPMVFKGSGTFQGAPNILSASGMLVLSGVAVMLVGVFLVTSAGLGREKAVQSAGSASQGFTAGLIMAFLAGILQAGSSFAFVYGQDPIVTAMKVRGAGDIAANIAVWSGCLFAGSFLNVVYPAYLMTVRKSWTRLFLGFREPLLSMMFGLALFAGFAMLGKGMLLIGALGASIGFGVHQSMLMLGGQMVGFFSGEWRGVYGVPRRRMYVAIGVLIIAAVIMSYGNTLHHG